MIRKLVLIAFLCLEVATATMVAQTGQGVLHGQITDPTGAVVMKATVTLTPAAGEPLTATSTGQGSYQFRGLAPGVYGLTVNASGFATYSTSNLNIAAGAPTQLDVTLEIAVKKEQVQVQGESNGVEVSPTDNATSTVLKGRDLDALSDDPDELQSDLEALAGPSAGPNGGQIYIDGFTNGTLPPKNSIREIRINQNPFSAQYDRLGYGRIEVFTKPGMDKFHGQLMYQVNDKSFNALNPYIFQQPGSGAAITIPAYTTQQFSGNFSGPLSKKASFFFSADRRNINDDAVINSPYLTQSQLVPTPRTRTNLGPRLDYQVTPGNTLTVRYQYWHDERANDGVGSFSLASQAYNTSSQNQEIQISDTQVLSPRVINETRFEYERTRSQAAVIDPDGSLPEINVQSYMVAGGNPIQHSADLSNNFELQNYTSMAMGKHFIKFGGRLRANRESDTVTSGSNGIYTFISANCPNLPHNPPSPYAACAGGTPSQYSVTVASPGINITYAAAGLYVEDDWRLRPNLTLSYGLRLESQTELPDHADFAPRIGISWGLGKGKSAPKTVLRVGWGMFYDRFSQSLVLQQEQGLTREQYIVDNKTPAGITTLQNCFAAYPAPCNLGGLNPEPTHYLNNPNLRTPYTMQAAVSLERQGGKIGTVAITYLNSRGLHQFYSRDLTPNTGVNNYEYASGGTFKQNQLIANVNLRVGARLTLSSFYMLGFANSNTFGANSFPSDPLNLNADWGRASYDNHQRAFLSGSFSLPWLIRVSPFVMINSGSPYNIVTGYDLNGDGVLSNDRSGLTNASSEVINGVNTPLHPASASCGGQGLYYDLLPNPKPIPANCGNGPALVTFNMRISKTIGLGRKMTAGGSNSASPQGGGGDRGGHGPGGPPGGGMVGRGMGNIFGSTSSDRRYNLTLSASVRNMFNHVNPTNPVANLSSSQFGQSNGLNMFGSPNSASNRRIELQMQFTF